MPRQETKASASAAATDGQRIGITTVAMTRPPPAPESRAASTSSRGSALSPARSTRKASGAWVTARSHMMPPGEYIGLSEPGEGAAPMAFRSGEAGPNSVPQASAITAGGTVIGSRKQKTRPSRARTSVSATRTAKAPPSTTAPIAPTALVSNECHAARHVAGRSRTAAAMVRSSAPRGATASTIRRAIGQTTRPMT